MWRWTSPLAVPCFLIAVLLLTADAPSAFAQKTGGGGGGRMPSSGGGGKGGIIPKGGNNVLPKAGNGNTPNNARAYQPSDGRTSPPPNRTNYQSSSTSNQYNLQNFTYTSPKGNTYDIASVTRQPPPSNTGGGGHGGGRENPNPNPRTTGTSQTTINIPKGPTTWPVWHPSNTGNSGYVRSQQPVVFVPGSFVPITLVTVTASKDKPPVNRLPDIIQAQSVRMASDTALVQGEPLPTPTTQLADGSVIDIAPHLLLREAHRMARNTDTLASAAERSLLVTDAEPALPADAKTPPMRSGLCLVNALGNKGPVSYLLNGEAHTLLPGQAHQLSADEYTIDYDRGGDLGAVTYELEEGTYAFRVSPDKGWDVYGKTYKVAMDNRANSNAFNFLLNGKQATVPAGEMKQFKSYYPVLASFDPGDNGEAARRWLLDGTYKVGVDPRAQLLELYQTAGTAAATSVGALTPARVDDAQVRR